MSLRLKSFISKYGYTLFRFLRIPPILSDSIVAQIANKHSKTPAQIALRFLVQQGHPVLPKSIKRDRLRTNIDIFSFCLDPEDMRALDKLDQGVEGGTWGFDVKNGMKGVDRHPEFWLSG